MIGTMEAPVRQEEVRAHASLPLPDLAELIATHKAGVYGYLSRSGIAPADRDDIFQEVFLSAHRALKSAPKDAITPWLFTIVVNAVRTHFRKARVRSIVRLIEAPEDRVATSDPGPDRQLEARRMAAWVDLQITRLPLEQREALLLCAVEGFELADAATVLGAPVETIKTRLRRARLALAEAHAKTTLREDREGVTR